MGSLLRGGDSWVGAMVLVSGHSGRSAILVAVLLLYRIASPRNVLRLFLMPPKC